MPQVVKSKTLHKDIDWAGTPHAPAAYIHRRSKGPTLGKIKQIMMVVLRHAEKYGHIPIGATELGKADRRRHHAEHVEHNPGCFSWPLVFLSEALHQRGTAAATSKL